ncbi:MAG: glutathionylspermidine synthase family protein [Armatimonadetes bacterium]|nr:glutathionylspermidine synthase family protein [Armatimonadota bacterium]
MKRFSHPPRPDWEAKVEEWGLTFHTHEGKPYWNESAHYAFYEREIDELEEATNALYRMCLQAVQFVIDEDRFDQMAVPPEAVNAIKKSWHDRPPTVYGRFDFGYDGDGPPKLFEFNADTPTSLLEAAVVQWQWLQEFAPEADQFNSLWEGLIEVWKGLKSKRGALKGDTVYFAHEAHMEDLMTVTVLRDTAQEAGLRTEALHMKDIGWHSARHTFVDLQERDIETVFKLYPWEWILTDKFGQYALATYGKTQWIEPVWKLLLANKGILAVLWEMFPGHPNLLPAYIGRSQTLTEYVKKPLYSREGANVMMKADGRIVRTPGAYGDKGYVFQGLYRLPDFEGNRPVIGSWVIGGEARGMGIRESDGPVTDDFARFVPHLFA